MLHRCLDQLHPDHSLLLSRFAAENWHSESIEVAGTRIRMHQRNTPADTDRHCLPTIVACPDRCRRGQHSNVVSARKREAAMFTTST
jgi:hypothetical protein